MDFDKYTDQELLELRELASSEFERRAKEKELEESKEFSARALVISKALRDGSLLDAISPRHGKSRYGNDCSDANPYGHERREYDNKEYNCQRCLLLAIARNDVEPFEVIELFNSLGF